VRIKILIIAAASIVLSLSTAFDTVSDLGNYAANAILRRNLHEVVPGELYRSAAMPSDEMSEVVKRLGIKTVIDVRRGGDRPDEFGHLESDVVEALGAKYVHVPLNGARLPPLERIELLLRHFDSVPRPVLIHCSSGTHRSGLASFIWLLTQVNLPPEVAIAQYSPIFGFLRWERNFKSWMQARPTIDKVAWSYLESFKSSPIGFREWARGALLKEDWQNVVYDSKLYSGDLSARVVRYRDLNRL
jgi:uncharacterized protein (TIGR01244 family)